MKETDSRIIPKARKQKKQELGLGAKRGNKSKGNITVIKQTEDV